MNIPELKTPIRIYWDLAPQEPGLEPDFPGIAEQIAGLKILSVDLTESAPAVSDACLRILARLSSEQMALSLTLPLSAITPATPAKLSGFRLKTLLVAVSSAAELAQVEVLLQSASSPVSIGISCAVTRANFRELPAMLSFCAVHGVPLVLPMQRLALGGDCFRLSREERQELSDRLREVARTERMRVVIHDPFLWRVFYPAASFPEGRCQAANTMLHIAANGDVFPCPYLPVMLGNLATTPLSVIAGSAEKKDLRGRLVAAPQGCQSCVELAECLGGCRGRGYCATGSWDEPDPGCG